MENVDDINQEVTLSSNSGARSVQMKMSLMLLGLTWPLRFLYVLTPDDMVTDRTLQV